MEEVRVLGCLVEKEATVPDAYPLTLNSLRTACNQTSSRDPVVSFDDLTIQRCLDRLKATGYVRFVHPSHGERATKFRHVADERLDLDRPQLAVLSVLALRGPQTSGELRTRTDRHHGFESVVEVEAVLAGLSARDEPLVVELPRLPGHHQARWAHLLSGPVDLDALAAAGGMSAPTRLRSAGGGGGFGGGADRIAELEATVASLSRRLARLEQELGIEPDPNGDAEADGDEAAVGWPGQDAGAGSGDEPERDGPERGPADGATVEAPSTGEAEPARPAVIESVFGPGSGDDEPPTG